MLKYHYNISNGKINDGLITCNYVTNKITSLFLDLENLQVKANPNFINSKNIILLNSELWDKIAQLKWVMSSDRVISLDEIQERLDALTAANKIIDIKKSMITIQSALVELYPIYKTINISVVIQIIALGHEIVTAVGTIPNFIDFIKSECQFINLYEILNHY